MSYCRGERNVIETFQTDVRKLNPGCFALVMATGIVSIAAHLEGMPLVAKVLFTLDNTFFIVLWLLTLGRCVRYGRELVDDLTHHAAGPGFLTVVTGTCVLGSQYVILLGRHDVALVLWIAGIVLWLVLIYTFFASVTVAEPKPSLDVGLSGGWLLATVSTQSIAVLGALLPPLPSIDHTG